jgi:hypothetical protein
MSFPKRSDFDENKPVIVNETHVLSYPRILAK